MQIILHFISRQYTTSVIAIGCTIVLMNILRKLIVSLLALVLSATLIGTVYSSVGVATIHNRQTVKGWFNKSDFYRQIVGVVLEKAKLSGKDTSIGSISVDDPEIQGIAKQAFNPSLLQKNVETALDVS